MGLTSALSLILVPVLIGHYGLASYGLLPLLRLLTPLGALGIAMLGLPQLATRAAALHAARGEAEPLRAAQSTLVALSALLGAAAAALMLAIGWSRFADWFNVTQDQHAAFSSGFNLTALLLPLLLPGFLLSASLGGLGRFKMLRLTEVSVYLLYFAAGICAVWAALPIQYVVIAFLAADALRAGVLVVYARQRSLIGVRKILMPDLRWLAAQMREFMVLSASGLLGYTRKHLVSGSIAVLFGPGALGLYDAVERVPRAFKSLLGLVNSAVLPHAIRLDAVADGTRLRSLLVRGTRLTLLFTVPLAATAIAYAGPIISVWLGKNLAHGGAFLVLLLIPFVLDATLSIATTASLSRLDLISRQNRIAVVEILVLLAVLALLVGARGETAPYVATAVAAVAGYMLRLRIFLPAYGIELRAWLVLLAKAAAGSALGAACVLAAMPPADAHVALLLSSLALAVLAGAGAVMLLWNQDERKDLRSVATSLRDMLSPRASR
jgi:O-antigen/teichoic acid export membrane protein